MSALTSRQHFARGIGIPHRNRREILRLNIFNRRKWLLFTLVPLMGLEFRRETKLKRQSLSDREIILLRGPMVEERKGTITEFT